MVLKLQCLLEYLGGIHLRQRLCQCLGAKREHVQKFKATFLFDLVNSNVMILQSKFHDIRRIINAIVEQAASLTDEVGHKFSDERGFAATDRSHQSDSRWTGKPASSDLVKDRNARRLKSLNSMILRRSLQGSTPRKDRDEP